MLTTARLRSILIAALGLETGAYVDALQARRMLPDDEPLNLRSVAIAALALVCGEEPAKAPSAALRLAEFRLTGLPSAAISLAARRWPGGIFRRLAARLPMRWCC